MNKASISIDDRNLRLVFADELKRLAALVQRSIRQGDDIVALSSLAAIGPIAKTLTEGALAAVANHQGEGCETESGQALEVDARGYL